MDKMGWLVGKKEETKPNQKALLKRKLALLRKLPGNLSYSLTSNFDQFGASPLPQKVPSVRF